MPKTTKKQKRQNRTPEEKVFLDEGLREIVVDALKKPDPEEPSLSWSCETDDWDGLGNIRRRVVGDGVDLLIAFDPLYHVTLLYAWGPHELYKGLVSELFPKPGSISGPAEGLCIFGSTKESVGGTTAALVWVNSSVPKQLSAATWVHEITHLSQDVLKHCGVDDANGEAQAYYVGREAGRVLKAFLGLDSTYARLPNKLDGLCQKVDEVVDACHLDKEKTKEDK